ncbi:MAG: tetratricopeptide repeat protein [Odoribacteraceae bacterium]|jgi:tetratricopeptide (TPR) repeat protein|nr:tetratricopeptide repeat protein [Odoribacteraceae bacterium]
MAKKIQKQDGFEQIQEATISTEQFIERNQKWIIRGVTFILVAIAAFFGYHKLYKAPLEKEARVQMASPERYFQQDSFLLALNGDGNALGFLEIIDQYGSTPSGNLANYYAGLCLLYTGDYQDAITYFNRFSSDDMVFSHVVKANIGDAYMELEDFKQAAHFYKQATDGNKNELTAPMILMKAGLAYEKSNDYKNALAAYEKLEKEFPNSIEARDIEKYIARSKANL